VAAKGSIAANVFARGLLRIDVFGEYVVMYYSRNLYESSSHAAYVCSMSIYIYIHLENPQRMVRKIKSRVVKPQPLVERTNTLEFILCHIEPKHVEVLRQSSSVVRLGDDGNAPKQTVSTTTTSGKKRKHTSA
jgi:hypothetical protein